MRSPLRHFALFLAIASAAWAAAPVLHLVGDSTLCDYPADPPNPQQGWGQRLPDYFRPDLTIKNWAVGGQSTHSFIAEKRWERVLRDVSAGDFVLLQFGHNDQKEKDPSRYADFRAAYPDNLRRMIADIRERGASPLLATSVVRRRWDAEGRLVETLGSYPETARAVAAETGVPLLEMHRLSKTLVEGHGPEGSKRLYLWIPPDTYVRNPKGWRDDSHFSAYGADRVAALAVQELIRLDHPLVRWLDSHAAP